MDIQPTSIQVRQTTSFESVDFELVCHETETNPYPTQMDYYHFRIQWFRPEIVETRLVNTQKQYRLVPKLIETFD